MPRKPRIFLPGIPCHVTQRGNNRNDCFYTIEDYRFYLDCMQDAALRFHVAIHAYVLMTNHVHLLLTPADEFGASRMIQSIGRRYVSHINRKYRRTGTLWEGRHKASPVDAEAYLLACYRYIELNPLRAGIVNSPDDYPWSSYLCHAYGDHDGLVTDHAVFENLGVTRDERSRHYREFVRQGVTEHELHKIRSTARFSMPLGTQVFEQRVERATVGRFPLLENGCHGALGARKSNRK